MEIPKWIQKQMLKNSATVLAVGPLKPGTEGVTKDVWPVLARAHSGDLVCWWVDESGYAFSGHYQDEAGDSFLERSRDALREHATLV